MHSSRMRTVRSSGRISGGVYLVRGGVPGRGTWSRGVPGLGGAPGPGGEPDPGGASGLGGVCT